MKNIGIMEHEQDIPTLKYVGEHGGGGGSNDEEVLRILNILLQRTNPENPPQGKLDPLEELILAGAFPSEPTLSNINWVWNSDKLGKVIALMLTGSEQKKLFNAKTTLASILEDDTTRRILVNSPAIMDIAMKSRGVKLLFAKNIHVVIEMLKSPTASSLITEDSLIVAGLFKNPDEFNIFWDAYTSDEVMRTNIMNSTGGYLQTRLNKDQRVLEYLLNYKSGTDYASYLQIFCDPAGTKLALTQNKFRYNYMEMSSLLMQPSNIEISGRFLELERFVMSDDERIKVMSTYPKFFKQVMVVSKLKKILKHEETLKFLLNVPMFYDVLFDNPSKEVVDLLFGNDDLKEEVIKILGSDLVGTYIEEKFDNPPQKYLVLKILSSPFRDDILKDENALKNLSRSATFCEDFSELPEMPKLVLEVLDPKIASESGLGDTLFRNLDRYSRLHRYVEGDTNRVHTLNKYMYSQVVQGTLIEVSEVLEHLCRIGFFIDTLITDARFLEKLVNNRDALTSVLYSSASDKFITALVETEYHSRYVFNREALLVKVLMGVFDISKKYTTFTQLFSDLDVKQAMSTSKVSIIFQAGLLEEYAKIHPQLDWIINNEQGASELLKAWSRDTINNVGHHINKLTEPNKVKILNNVIISTINKHTTWEGLVADEEFIDFWDSSDTLDYQIDFALSNKGLVTALRNNPVVLKSFSNKSKAMKNLLKIDSIAMVFVKNNELRRNITISNHVWEHIRKNPTAMRLALVYADFRNKILPNVALFNDFIAYIENIQSLAFEPQAIGVVRYSQGLRDKLTGSSYKKTTDWVVGEAGKTNTLEIKGPVLLLNVEVSIVNNHTTGISHAGATQYFMVNTDLNSLISTNQFLFEQGDFKVTAKDSPDNKIRISYIPL